MDFRMSWIGLDWGFGGVYGFFLFFSFPFFFLSHFDGKFVLSVC